MMSPTTTSRLTWRKGGQIFRASGQYDWMQSHTQNPTPVVLDDRIRVYFNTRPQPKDGLQSSHPAYVDVDLVDPSTVLAISDAPVLALGERGCFDQHGCMCSSVVDLGGELWMYYVGWKRCIAVPYDWAIGLAISRDRGCTFEKAFRGPVIGASQNEPYLQNGCYVIRGEDGEWHVWYSTGVGWLGAGDKPESRYIIVHATSRDGVNWQRNALPVLPEAFEAETQTTPTIFRANRRYHMLFSSRHSRDFRNAQNGYRIGYAWSTDLENWHREDAAAGLDLSDSGWDSEMMCYPQVCQFDGRTLMFYSGNYFGRDGFGYAELLGGNS
jgi:hypothetical protein